MSNDNNMLPTKDKYKLKKKKKNTRQITKTTYIISQKSKYIFLTLGVKFLVYLLSNKYFFYFFIFSFRCICQFECLIY